MPTESQEYILEMDENEMHVSFYPVHLDRVTSLVRVMSEEEPAPSWTDVWFSVRRIAPEIQMLRTVHPRCSGEEMVAAETAIGAARGSSDWWDQVVSRGPAAWDHITEPEQAPPTAREYTQRFYRTLDEQEQARFGRGDQPSAPEPEAFPLWSAPQSPVSADLLNRELRRVTREARSRNRRGRGSCILRQQQAVCPHSCPCRTQGGR